MKANELMIGVFVYFNCFDGSKVVVRVTGFNDGIVYGDSKNGSHWCNINKVEPIPLTQEILEKNGFKKDAFTNLSLDYYYGDDEYSICVNLNSTCDKSKSVWVEKRSSRFRVSIEESRHSLDKKPLYVHELQHALRLCGIEKDIVL